MKYFTFFFLLSCSNLFAQNSQVDYATLEEGVFSLDSYLQIYRDSSRTLSWEKTYNILKNDKFTNYEGFQYQDKLTRGKNAYWFHLTINCQADNLDKMLFRCISTDSIQLFLLINGELKEHNVSGGLVDNQYDALSPYAYHKSDVPFELVPNAKNEVLIRMRSLPGFSPQHIKPSLLKEKFTLTKRGKWLHVFFMTEGILLGILFFVAVFTFVQYFQNKDVAFLFYGLYVFSLFIFFLRKFYISNPLFSFDPLWIMHTRYYTWFMIPTYGTYLLFIRNFLETKVNFPRFEKFIKFSFGYIFIYLLVERTLMYFDLNMAYSFEKITRPFYTVISLSALIFLIKSRNKLAYYVFFGSASLVFFSCLGHLFSFFDNTLWQWWDLTYFFSIFGIFIELLFFSTGLGFKTKLVTEEKNKVQEDLLQQLNENQILKDKLTKNLTTKLHILKNQLKPHFIFNCLTSIKNLIIKDKKETAEIYLIRFAELMRETLNFSDKEQVTLEEELNFSENYLELEQMRFRDRFNYSIGRENVPTSTILIPPMLLQPFIENAIKHGLLPKEGNRTLAIILQAQNDYISCSVIDNGIGRAEAARLSKNAFSNQNRIQKGLMIAKEQLDIYNEYFNTNIQIIITDLVEANGTAIGTKVEFIFPKSI